MALVTPKDQDVVYNPIFVHLDSGKLKDKFSIVESSASYMNASEDDNGNVVSGAAKKSRVTLDKESHNADDYTDSVSETQPNPKDDGDTTKPYDNLTFKVTTTIPGYGDSFDYPVFNMTDKMNGLKLMYPGAEAGSHTNAEGETVEDIYAANIIVKVGDTEYTVNALTDGVYENDVFKITPTADEYTIEFKEDFLKTVHVPTSVEVTYQAKVQEGENNNVIKEKNTVTLEFSHDPTTESDQNKGGDKQYKKDVTNHYTFTIDANNLVGPNGLRPGESGSELVKVAVDKSGNPIFESWTWSNVGEPETSGQKSPLANAEFTLYGSKADGSIDRDNVVGKATSDASGRINFTGLDAGKYWLEEDKAPAGYVKQSGQFPVVITAQMDEKEITEYTTDGETWISEADYEALDEDDQKEYQSFTYKTDELKSYKVMYGAEAAAYTFDHIHESANDQIKWSIAESSEAPQSIVNTKGVELPSTGGIGTRLFYIIGAILVVGAGVVLVTRRRMSTN
jgi:LPXTG-motif cell wall-anchored protein